MSDRDRPVFTQVNLIISNMAKAVDFYRRLGVEVADTEPQWENDHRNVESVGDVRLELDSPNSVARWNQGWPQGRSGAVVGFSVVGRDTVDAIYADVTGAGYTGQQPPHDAFWGARYAVVTDPDGNAVGIMSAVDPSRKS